MPYISPEKRAEGSRLWSGDPRDWPHGDQPCDCDWTKPKTAAELRHRHLPEPDQSRYGTATSDPLGREGPGWQKGKNGLPVRIKGKGDQ